MLFYIRIVPNFCFQTVPGEKTAHETVALFTPTVPPLTWRKLLALA